MNAKKPLKPKQKAKPALAKPKMIFRGTVPTVNTRQKGGSPLLPNQSGGPLIRDDIRYTHQNKRQQQVQTQLMAGGRARLRHTTLLPSVNGGGRMLSQETGSVSRTYKTVSKALQAHKRILQQINPRGKRRKK